MIPSLVKIGSRIRVQQPITWNVTFDLEVTLTFDLPIMQLHVMNAHTLKHIHTRLVKLRLTVSAIQLRTDGRTDGRTDEGREGRTRDRPRSSFHSIPSLRLGTQKYSYIWLGLFLCMLSWACRLFSVATAHFGFLRLLKFPPQGTQQNWNKSKECRSSLA